MNVLAFDTCFGAASAAVRWKGDGGAWLLREIYEEMATGQAERLMPMVAEVMKEADLTFSDLDCIAVTCGPGSFTGVRVGVAAARALALATSLPVVAQTSLAVMAARAREMLGTDLRDGLAVAVDARRGGVYLQLFDPRSAEAMSPPEVLSPEEAALRMNGRHIAAVGSGAGMLARAVTAKGVGTVEPMLLDLQPHARFLALMAPSLATVTPVKPLYLRAPDAKPQKGSSLTATE